MEKYLNKINHGDCFEIMKELPDNSVDMILTDPPYGTTACDWDQVPDLELMWSEFNRVIKDNGAMVVFSSQPFTTDLIQSNRKYFKYEIIWIKEQGTGFARSKFQPLKQHENILLFYKSQPKHDHVGDKLDKPYTCALPVIKSKSDCIAGSGYDENNNRIYHLYTHKTKTSVVNFSREKKGRDHPTQKPEKLFSYLIKTYSNEGDLILDPFGGSGVTAIAASINKRDFIVIEKEKEYYDLSCKRLKDYNYEYEDPELQGNNILSLLKNL